MPVYFNGEKHEATGTGEDLFDYITVDIGDWLDAQQNFISEFCSNYQVTDNSSGNADSPLNYDGIPLTYDDGTYVYSDLLANLSGPGSFLYENCGFELTDGGQYIYGLNIITNGSITGSYNISKVVFPDGIFIRIRCGKYNGVKQICANPTNSPGASYAATLSGNMINQSNVTWTSDTVNENVFDNYGSAKVKIPYGNLTTGWGVPDFLDVLNTLWENNQQNDIVIEDGDNPPTPPVPVPTIPLGDIPTDEWMDLYGSEVLENLENTAENVNDIPGLIENTNDTLDNIDSNIEDATDTLDSIDNNIGIGNGILGGIRSVLNTISSDLSSIKQGVLDLINEIVLATENLIAGI